MTGIGLGLSFTIPRTSANGLKRNLVSLRHKNHALISQIYFPMKISKIKFYGGSREKVCRLGLAHIFLELQEILISTDVRVLKEKQASSAR